MTPAPLQLGQAPSELALNSAGFTPLAFANALRIGSSSPVYVAGLLLGMQPRPGRHGHGAVLLVLAREGGGRGRPGGRVGAVELGPVAARPAGRAGWRVGVEAAVRPQPHQHRRLGVARFSDSWAES